MAPASKPFEAHGAAEEDASHEVAGRSAAPEVGSRTAAEEPLQSEGTCADESPAGEGVGAELAARAAVLLDGLGDGTPLWSRDNALRVALFTLGAAAYAAIGYWLMARFPSSRELYWYGLYACPSHMLISPFPHEPAIFAVAPMYPPLIVASVGTVGCMVAGVFDYLLLTPLLHSVWVRRQVRQVSLLGKSLAFFYRWPFGMLVIAALTPVPFYPFKFLSILGGYPLWKYELALLVGRWPRFLAFAYVGDQLHVPLPLLLLFAFFGVVVFAVKVVRAQRAERRAAEAVAAEPR